MRGIGQFSAVRSRQAGAGNGQGLEARRGMRAHETGLCGALQAGGQGARKVIMGEERAGAGRTVVEADAGIVGGDEEAGGVARQELHARDLAPARRVATPVLHVCAAMQPCGAGSLSSGITQLS